MKYTLHLILLTSSLFSFARAESLQDRAKPYLATALAAGDAFVNVSAASGMPNLGPDSLVTAFGSSLAAQTATGAAPFPTSLGGVSVQVVDSAGAVQLAPLMYVSPSQINYLMPPNIAKGMATISIVNGTDNVKSTATIQSIAPALFTANGDGQGVVSATAYRTVIPTAISSPVRVYQCLDAPGSCVSVPIDPGVDAPVTVTLYATGLRGRSGDSGVTLTIGGSNVPIRSISATDHTGPSPGIDQVTFGLPLSLRGSGEVDVVLSVDGLSSNTGRINIQ